MAAALTIKVEAVTVTINVAPGANVTINQPPPAPEADDGTHLRQKVKSGSNPSPSTNPYLPGSSQVRKIQLLSCGRKEVVSDTLTMFPSKRVVIADW